MDFLALPSSESIYFAFFLMFFTSLSTVVLFRLSTGAALAEPSFLRFASCVCVCVCVFFFVLFFLFLLYSYVCLLHSFL